MATRQLKATVAFVLGKRLSEFFGRAAQSQAQEVLADQRKVALNDQKAKRFLDALAQPDEATVAGLEDLRRRV